MTPTPKAGQRYHYHDGSQDVILELLSPAYDDRWNVRFLQCMRGRRVGEETDFTMYSGNWEYLEGQDKPV